MSAKYRAPATPNNNNPIKKIQHIIRKNTRSANSFKYIRLKTNRIVHLLESKILETPSYKKLNISVK